MSKSTNRSTAQSPSHQQEFSREKQQTSLKIEKKGILKRIEAFFSLNKQPFFPLERTNWCRLHELNQSLSFLVGDYFLNTLSFCKKEKTKTQQVWKKKFILVVSSPDEFTCLFTWQTGEQTGEQTTFVCLDAGWGEIHRKLWSINPFWILSQIS